MSLRTPLRAIAASAAVLALTLSACGSEPTAGPGGAEAPKSAEVAAEFAQVDAALVSGLVSSVYTDEVRDIRAEVPVITTARQMTSAMEVLRENGLRQAAWEQASHVDISYQVVASGPGILGIVVTPAWTSGTGETTNPALVWYDAATKRVFSSPVVIREAAWTEFTDEVADAAGRKADKTKLLTAMAANPAPQGDGPMLGFDAKGNLVARFEAGVVADKPLSVRVSADKVAPLLSEFGQRAAEASRAPAAFDGTPPPGTAPIDENSTGPTATTGATATPGSGGAATPTPAATGTPQATRPSTAVGPDCTVLECVALTYDDGPGADTPKLLEALLAAKAPATFFQLGQMIEANPTIAKEVASNGNEVASHSFTHPNLATVSATKLEKEITDTAAAMEEVYGRKPMIFRPPYGAHNKAVDEVLRSSGAAIIQWDVDTNDWKTRSTSDTENAAVYGRGVQGGSIILMHDIHPSTVAAAPGILAGLQKKGVTLVTVSELSLNSAGYQAGRAYCNGTTRAQDGFNCEG